MRAIKHHHKYRKAKVARNKLGQFVGGREKRKCPVCKKNFEVYKSSLRKTCGGKKCKYNYRSSITQGENNPNWNPNIKEKTCPVCKNSFYPKKGRRTQVTCAFKCFKKLFIGRRPMRAKGGKRKDLENVYFRSVWEANFARYLNYHQTKWEYEPKTFIFKEITRGAKSYLPDFYLPETKEYVEVKGWMTSKSKTQLKRMKKYYPKVKITLLDKEKYFRIERQWSGRIKNWEYSEASQSQGNKKDVILIEKVRKILEEKGLC